MPLISLGLWGVRVSRKDVLLVRNGSEEVPGEGSSLEYVMWFPLMSNDEEKNR